MREFIALFYLLAVCAVQFLFWFVIVPYMAYRILF